MFPSFSRRRFVTIAASASLVSALPSLCVGMEDAEYSDPEGRETWLSPLLGLGASTGALLLGKFADRMYFTTGEIGWGPNPGQKGPPPVDVPVGFVTDLASIPRVFWSILPSDGRYAHSAVIHDYLYWEQSISREESDEVMALSMADFGVADSTIKIIHTAIRSFGGQRAWDNNARLKARGEKRVLNRFPDDPTVPWSDWKLRSGVFG